MPDRRTREARGPGPRRIRHLAPIIVGGLLVALTGLAVWLVAAALTTSKLGTIGNAPAATATIPATEPPVTGPARVPTPPWRVIAHDRALTRIGVGSCLDQAKPQPIWQAVLAAKPDLFLMIGDNVYGDIKSNDGRELAEAYRRQAEHPEFRAAVAALPMLATWDDHDYGGNDQGADFRHKRFAAELFRTYWGLTEPAPGDGGIYRARIIGPVGRRVQVILLDLRSFRGELTRKTSAFAHWGRYEPDTDPENTLLGRRQWSWLERELAKPAEVRIIVSSIQVLAEGHGYERWGNVAFERTRLLELIAQSGATGVILVSGDRHAGAIYRKTDDVAYPLVELTTSSLNKSFGPSKDARMPPLASDIYHPENFGLVDIDWVGGSVRLALHGMDGSRVAEITQTFQSLGIARAK